MKTIVSDVASEIIVNKSRFITNIIKIEDKEDALDKLSKIKDKYSDATHNCYAYITFNTKKASDDFEPSGTAGIPILNVLENNDLVNVLCVVTRYFGGIKLGTGGLARAYTNSVTSALSKAKIKSIDKSVVITISFKYDDLKNIDYILKKYNIISKNFDVLITYTVVICYNEYLDIKDSLCKLVINLTEDKIIYI